MRLNIGDKIYCKKEIGNSEHGLTVDKCYEVVTIRPKNRWNGDDICIYDDFGSNCWSSW